MTQLADIPNQPMSKAKHIAQGRVQCDDDRVLTRVKWTHTVRWCLTIRRVCVHTTYVRTLQINK